MPSLVSIHLSARFDRIQSPPNTGRRFALTWSPCACIHLCLHRAPILGEDDWVGALVNITGIAWRLYRSPAAVFLKTVFDLRHKERQDGVVLHVLLKCRGVPYKRASNECSTFLPGLVRILCE